MEFKPHSLKQERAIFSQKPIVLLATGIQYGKTQAGAIKTRIALHTYTDPSDNFLVLAPTYKIMKQSTLPAFEKWCGNIGKLNKTDMEFKVYGGGTVYLRTGTDADSIVGATNVRFIHGDEAGKYSLYFWENIQGRAAFKKAQIMLTTSPYTLNWIHKELIKPKMKDPNARPDVDLFQASSIENPYFPKDYYEKKRMEMDPRRFNMMFGGQWEKMEGLVYDCFDEDLNTCQPFAIPSDWEVFAGVDWGYTNPFACNIIAMSPKREYFQIAEIYKSSMRLTKIVDTLSRLKIIYNIKKFYCDPSNPAYIEELNKNKLPAIPANNDIKIGIDRVYELIKSRRFKVFKTNDGKNRFTLDEIESYHYPDFNEIKPDQDIKENLPVKQDDHAMDALRYAIVMMHTKENTQMPRAVAQNNVDKNDNSIEAVIKRVRTPSYNPFYEEW